MIFKRVLFLIMIALWLGFVVSPFLTADAPEACIRYEPGVADYSACAFDDETVYRLTGEWVLVRDAFVPPGELGDVAHQPAERYISVPSAWSGLLRADREERLGYGTYALRLVLPASDQDYGLRVGDIRSASQLFADGESAGGRGEPGDMSESTVSHAKPYTATLQSAGGTVELVVHIANYRNWLTGIAEPLLLGSAEAVAGQAATYGRYDVAVMVSLVISGVYYASLGMQSRKEPAFFWLASFCLLAAVHVTAHGEKLLYTYIPSLSYGTLYQIQMFAPLLALLAMIGYFHCIHPDSLSRAVFRWAGSAVAVLAVLSLLVGERSSALIVYPALAFALLAVIYVVYAVFRAISRRLTGSVYLLVAMLGAIQFAAGYAGNMMLMHEVYRQKPYGIAMFLLAQGLFLGARSKEAMDRIRELTVELRQQSAEKDEFLRQASQELRTPLQAMLHLIRSLIGGTSGPLAERQRKDMLLVEHTTQRLAFLMNDLFDYERIKDGSLALRRQPLELAGLVEVVLEVFRQVQADGQIALCNRIEPGRYSVYGDEDRVTQIVYHLIEEAMQELAAGEIRLIAEQEDRDVRLTVIASGPGSAAKGQAESVGIAISRLLARLHRGELSLGPGTEAERRYAVRLPLA
ncbi:sensor histidine kinase, partial [Paenibacillus sp. 598K]|uniref:sensor histidine kinase n=1 Tax=Paenibacillus sp. 598K TaxID=1117987 RepID=UPI00162697FC